jgi:hypothetical protein
MIEGSQATDDSIIWCMLPACSLTKDAHTNSEYVTIFNVPRQQ